MKFAKGFPLYFVRRSGHSNSHQECWGSLKFANDENFNSVVMIFLSLKVTIFLFLFSYLFSTS